jgi:D-alanine-D-alanine ligase
VCVIDTVEGPLSQEQEGRLLVPAVGREPPSFQELELLKERELGPALAELPELKEADLVFLVLHGVAGEGGQIQALLELAGVLYTGSGPLGSALAMDKDMAKRICRDAGIPTPDWLMWPAAREAIERLGYPLVVKPSKTGSTVGTSVVRAYREVEAAVAEALRYDDEVLLEAFLPGRELTVGVLGERALAVGEVVPPGEIFDYQAKYTPGATREIFPAALPEELTQRVKSLALAAHRALKLRDFSRVDFRLDSDGTPCFLEANTLPGLTATSLLPQSAAASGIGFAELCETVCRLALMRGARNKVAT